MMARRQVALWKPPFTSHARARPDSLAHPAYPFTPPPPAHIPFLRHPLALSNSARTLEPCAQTFAGMHFRGRAVGECASRVEDKMMLRERTLQLLELLTESEHRSLALVTHKGYLREVRSVTGLPTPLERHTRSVTGVTDAICARSGDASRRCARVRAPVVWACKKYRNATPFSLMHAARTRNALPSGRHRVPQRRGACLCGYHLVRSDSAGRATTRCGGVGPPCERVSFRRAAQRGNGR